MKETLPQKNLQGSWEFTTGYEPAYFDVKSGDRWHFEYSANPSDPIEGTVEMFRDGSRYNSGTFKQYDETSSPSGYDLEMYMENSAFSYRIASITEFSMSLRSPRPYAYPGNFDKANK